MIKEIDLLLPELHPAQFEVWKKRSRFNVLACGRRWGKTTLGLTVCLMEMLEGHPVAWGAPHYKFLADPMREMKKLLLPVIERSAVSERRIELITGGSIDFWTLEDEDAGRGKKYKQWVIDEAASVRGLERLFWEAMRPTLTDLRGGMWMLGTPQGRGFFWQSYVKGLDENEPEWFSAQAPSRENPAILESEILAAKSSIPDRIFRQEYLAEFLESTSAVFPDFGACIDSGRSENEEPEEGKRYRMGLDLARKQDYSVVTVFDNTGKQVYFERWHAQGWEKQISRVVQICERFDCDVIVDATGLGDVVVEQMRVAGLVVHPFLFTAGSRSSLLDNLALELENKRLRLMDIPVQSHELSSFDYEALPGGGWKAVASGGGNDDCVMALALAVWPIGRGTFDAVIA